MKTHSLKLAIAASAMTAFLAGCGDDVLVTEKTDQAFTTVSALDPDDCNSKTEGSMAFVKKNSTMYVCTDGEWVAMNDQDAIEYRCETKALKDKSGFELFCDGESIGVFKNGENGENGKPGTSGKNGSNGDDGEGVDMDELEKSIDKAIGKGKAEVEDDLNKKLSSASAKGKSDLDSKLSSASEKVGKDADKKLSSASAKHEKEINDLDKKLSSASAKNKKDNKDINEALDDINDNVLSSASKSQEEFDKKLSSLADEFDKSCKVNGEPVTSDDGNTITVSVKCGEATKEFVIDLLEENLKNVYKKHVVVRFPVQSEKTTRSEDIYEEIWANLKGGDHAELTVTDLNKNLDATGNLFVTDLFADATKKGSFVTVEGTNEKEVNYNVVRLEGDLDITNLSTPVVQLHVTLKLGNYWVNEELALNAIVDLTDKDIEKADASDTVVIDFLTDYKAARVKNLVDAGSKFAAANKQANEELAAALYLNNKNSDEYPAFEHFVPDQLGLLEHFNSIAWVMALIDQKSKTPGFNAVYNAFRNVFAENGDFNKAITTTYAGEDRSMFFVDYLALLIDANFFKWNQMQHGDYTAETNVWSGTDAVYYKIVQNGFVEAYKLKVEDAKVFNNSSGYSSKVYKSDVKGGYFHYFEYIENDQVWYPVTLWAVGVATVEKVCDADAVNSTFFYSFEGLDDNAVCVCDNGECYWQDPENVCLGRNKGDKGSAFFDGEIQEYECVEAECDLSASSTCDDLELVPVWESSSSVANSSSSFAEQNGKTPEELANDPSSPLYLGACNAENVGKEKPFDIKNAENATTTGSMTYVCDGVKWRKLNGWDEEFGICTKSVMEQGAVKDVPGSRYMKCEYLDNENKYEWIEADSYDYYAGKACHYGNVDKNLFSEDNDYICVTAKDENGKNRLDNKGNHVHEWRDATADDYCVGDRVVSTKQKVADENLGELTFNEKCKFKESVYVRNNTEEGTSEWVSNWTFVGNNRTESGYVIFMEGYRDDNEVYYCGDWCDGSSVDAVKARLAVTSSSSQQQELLNIICNMGEYNRVSAGAYAVETIAFEVEVQLSEAEIKKTYVASAKRNDWHVATLNDILGACTETVMSSQTAAVTFKNIDYKCDCEKDGDTYKSCAWGEISEKENELKLLCTVNLVGEASNDYVCMNADAGHDWRTVTAEEWCPTHGQNLTGGTSYNGICDDVPGDNTTYLLIGSASSWAQVPNTYRWNDDNITTADKKAVEAQLISGNSCTDKDIVSLLYDYTIKGTTDRVHDFICKNGKLRVAKDEQEACGKAYETTEVCKYMNEWYQYEGDSWKKVLCGEKSYNPEDHFCDARDADNPTAYRMVTIGEGEKAQTWMAENMNYKTASGSSCYDVDPENCSKYGRLYDDFYVAKNACPIGWHLPDTTEWNILGSNVDSHFYGLNGGNNKAGKYLKAKEGWKQSSGSAGGNGTDDFLFSVQPDPTGNNREILDFY